jgi:phosphogluconate dehydratase
MKTSLINPSLNKITANIVKRSQQSRADYLQRMAAMDTGKFSREMLSCGNLAHGVAACGQGDKDTLKSMLQSDIGIISAYNDILSAHQPYQRFPKILKEAVAEMGSVAQFAGGVPAMCDGVTQGHDGMDLSLFSRDVIAMSTAIALSHNLFDAGLCLGVCDKIVPGLLIGALSFGHLPFVFVPAGPMPSGLPNKEKARIRQLYAEGKATRDELLECEMASYHGAGTCTFYGTANSNQLLMEVMGLHLPGSSFVPPEGEFRDVLTKAAAQQAVKLTRSQDNCSLAKIISEKTIVNAIVALLATGGSSNHVMHLVAIARAAGIIINWDDFSALSEIVPSITRIYPNGEADINVFHAAGGVPFVIRTLLEAGLLHEDVHTILGFGLANFTKEPILKDNKIGWQDAPKISAQLDVLRPASSPFSKTGGLTLLTGNLGRSVMKVSAVAKDCQQITAPAMVFDSQQALKDAFDLGKMEKDLIAVVRFQGPQACGMPELHQLITYLGVLQDRGFKVALVTDGRLSGASGKVPAATKLWPEAKAGGLIAKVMDGDLIVLDCEQNKLELMIDEAELNQRELVPFSNKQGDYGMGRELFSSMRAGVSSAEFGASCFWPV